MSAELAALRARVEELEDTVRALRHGEVDALVVYDERGPQIYTLQGAEHPYRVMVEAMHEGAATVTHEGLVLYCNRSLAAMVGVPLPSVIGTRAQGMVPPREVPAFEKLLADGAQVSTRSELTLQRPDGTCTPVLMSASPADIAADEAEICLVVTDLTERKRAERVLEELNEGLERMVAERTAELMSANRELEAFAYSVSHDLRSPLRAIRSFSEILADNHATSLGEEARHCLQVIRSSAATMDSLILGLLELSRLGTCGLLRTAVDMNELVGTALHELELVEPGDGLEIRVGELPPAEGDPSLLRQVWVNLLSNARKFTRHATPARIEIGGRRADGELVYHVLDNGVGFDARYAHKLFQTFQRLHSQRDFEGSGVGLALVERIVNRHGGRVWASSQPGKGATFYFSLPPGPDMNPMPDRT